MKTVKLASTRYLDRLPTSGNDGGRAFRDLDMERQVLKIAEGIERWEIQIRDAGGNPVRSYGEGALGGEIRWDGRGDDRPTRGSFDGQEREGPGFLRRHVGHLRIGEHLLRHSSRS